MESTALGSVGAILGRTGYASTPYLSTGSTESLQVWLRRATDHIVAGGSAALWLGCDSTTLGGDVLDCDGRDGLFGQT